MTTEEKDLLLKDLCARLPYGVKVYNEVYRWTAYPKGVVGDRCYFNDNPRYDGDCTVEEVKPYLRPMNSMTEEEKEYIKNRWCYEDWNDIHNFLNHYQIDAGDAFSFVDWLNSHNFDYRGLIVKRLALEAPEDMYKKN